VFARDSRTSCAQPVHALRRARSNSADRRIPGRLPRRYLPTLRRERLMASCNSPRGCQNVPVPSQLFAMCLGSCIDSTAGSTANSPTLGFSMPKIGIPCPSCGREGPTALGRVQTDEVLRSELGDEKIAAQSGPDFLKSCAAASGLTKVDESRAPWFSPVRSSKSAFFFRRRCLPPTTRSLRLATNSTKRFVVSRTPFRPVGAPSVCQPLVIPFLRVGSGMPGRRR